MNSTGIEQLLAGSRDDTFTDGVLAVVATVVLPTYPVALPTFRQLNPTMD